MVQEFFGSRDDESQLRLMLGQSCFEVIPEYGANWYSAEGALVTIQAIDGERHIARTNPVPVGFVMQIWQPLETIASTHPLRHFFSLLDQPQAYGCCGFPAKHKVEEYLPR